MLCKLIAEHVFLFLSMKHILVYSILLFALAACTSTPEKAQADIVIANPLDSAASFEFKYSIIRFAGKLPGKADHQTKFNSNFDEHYIKLASNHSLDYLVKVKDLNRTYFMLSRIAPSIKLKKVGVGGFVDYNQDGTILRYRELFRTWKMVPETLEVKGKMLFEKMVAGEDLSPYYPENSNGEEYIEFPNKDAYFDTLHQRWETGLDDYMEPYYQLKGKGDTSGKKARF